MRNINNMTENELNMLNGMMHYIFLKYLFLTYL